MFVYLIMSVLMNLLKKKNDICPRSSSVCLYMAFHYPIESKKYHIKLKYLMSGVSYSM